jgi:hypothetical protein
MIENTINKNLYKIFLIIIKFIPNMLAGMKIIGLVLSYFKISSFILTCSFGTSIIFIIILYLISIIFKFCGTHRLSLHYVSLITVLSIIDYYIGIPLSNIGLYYLYSIITGIFITLWIYIWYKNRNNPKIDYIKQLCDNYTDCGCK